MNASAVRPTVDLLVLPCAGASATMYLRWRRFLSAWLRLVPLELPGRGERYGEPLVEDFQTLVAQLAERYAESLRGQYVLLGHSMGALLAYGLAQTQRTLQRPLPNALFVCGSAAPALRDVTRFSGKLDDEVLIADLRRQGGTPEELFQSPELLRMTLDTLAADYRLCASYRHQQRAPLPLPIHALGGRADEIAPASLTAWAHETAASFSMNWFEGGHFFIRQQEPEVLTVLERELQALFSPTDHASAATA
ncbi:Surfactin synthase thioesterase subunit [Roseateles sp. YR242]|uniref:thioesterase II family protein n=1 Tax=Roseateles sp. YR242 TaxID=1855305 RepID=UPI0008D38E21|nr:alpha/beta fold hydrolase [Roseateles sp. YR242]SEL61907.1 Surfactin synthase thioesterase subunit [Roseateles sp. YR242]